jgi:hypothetical protein
MLANRMYCWRLSNCYFRECRAVHWHNKMHSLQRKGWVECQSKNAFPAAVSKPRSRGTETTHVLGKGGHPAGWPKGINPPWMALAYQTSSDAEERRRTMASGNTVLPPLECVCVSRNYSIGLNLSILARSKLIYKYTE